MAARTIYDVLKIKLGREPTHAELTREVKRILEIGTREFAERGKLRHQKKNPPRRARARAPRAAATLRLHDYACVVRLPNGRQKRIQFRARSDPSALRYARGLLAHRHKGKPVSLRRLGVAKKNPSRRAEATKAAHALEEFTGAPARLSRRKAPKTAKAGWELGRVASISYIATRDGEQAEYVHKFKRRSRPQLVSSADGSQLYMLGGAYSITDRGIEDR